MTRSSRWLRVPGLVAAALILSGLAVIVTGSAAAETTGKSYTATLDPLGVPENGAPDGAVEAWAGSSPTLRITLTNRTNPQALGSADITVPAGLTVTSLALTSDQAPFTGTATLSQGVIRLRDLALNPEKSAFLSIGVRAECTPNANPYTFGTAVKQSNDFNGTGNDFLLDGFQPALDLGPHPALNLANRCSLAFTAQPRDAQRSSNVTSEVFLPAGAPVAVTVLDGSGASPVAWWTTPVTLGLAANPGDAELSGYISDVPSAGVAAFNDPSLTVPGPRINVSATGYALSAASTGISAPSPQSLPFGIFDVGKRCIGQQNCSGASSSLKNTATVSAVATSDDDLLRVSLAAPTSSFVCPGYTTTTDVLDFDLTSLTGAAAGGRKTAVFTLLAAYVTRPASKYDACFFTPLPFTTKSGAPATGVNTDADAAFDFYVGLLPTCSRQSPVPPCVNDRTKNRAGDVTLTIFAPPGDPRAKF